MVSGVLPYLLASAGPATGVLEAFATSIGAGLVVGGFAGGIQGLISNRSRSRSEAQALKGSYAGGAMGLMALLIDTVGERFV